MADAPGSEPDAVKSVRVRISLTAPRFADVVEWNTQRFQKPPREHEGSSPSIGTKYGEMGEWSKPRHC